MNKIIRILLITTFLVLTSCSDDTGGTTGGAGWFSDLSPRDKYCYTWKGDICPANTVVVQSDTAPSYVILDDYSYY